MAHYIQILCLSRLNLINQRNVSHIKLSKYCDIDAHLSHSTPLFKSLKILKLEDLYITQLYKLYHKKCQKFTSLIFPKFYPSV